MVILKGFKIQKINSKHQEEIIKFLRKFVNPFEPLLASKLNSPDFTETDQIEADKVNHILKVFVFLYTLLKLI